MQEEELEGGVGGSGRGVFGDRKQYKHQDLKQPALSENTEQFPGLDGRVPAGKEREGRLGARPRPENESIPVSECFPGRHNLGDICKAFASLIEWYSECILTSTLSDNGGRSPDN